MHQDFDEDGEEQDPTVGPSQTRLVAIDYETQFINPQPPMTAAEWCEKVLKYTDLEKPMLELLNELTIPQLRALASQCEVAGWRHLSRDSLTANLVENDQAAELLK